MKTEFRRKAGPKADRIRRPKNVSQWNFFGETV